MEKLLGKSLFNQIMKRSFYGHFVAGENQEEINVKIIKSFHSFKYLLIIFLNSYLFITFCNYFTF